MDQTLEERVQAIEERNKRVELDKKWETSFSRIFTVSLFTYVVASLALYVIHVANPLKGALIPTLGFILSTQSVPIIKKYWMRGK